MGLTVAAELAETMGGRIWLEREVEHGTTFYFTAPFNCRGLRVGENTIKLFRRPSAEALWKDEFLINTADERYVNRRQFTKFLVLTSLAMFAGNVWILVRSWLNGKPDFPAVTVAKADEIGIGGVKLFSYPKPHDKCILIRTGPESYVAYSQKCTHLSCAVYYSQQANRLECPCHEGYFSVKDGSVLQGPPPRPLPQVMLQRRGNELVAVGLEVHRGG